MVIARPTTDLSSYPNQAEEIDPLEGVDWFLNSDVALSVGWTRIGPEGKDRCLDFK